MNGFFVKTLFCLSLLLFVACKVEIPDGVIKPDKMEELLYDYHLVQVITSDYSSTSYERKLHINYLFDKHGVTKEMFDSSMVWYTRYPKRLVSIYSNLEKRTTQEYEAMTGGENSGKELVIDKEKMLADTVELWGGARVRLLSSSPLNNKVLFNYTADSTYVKGDSIVLSFTARHLPGKMEQLDYRAHAALLVEYHDKTVAKCGLPIVADSAYCVAVERNYDSYIKSMQGFIYYADNDTLCSSKLLLGEISFRRIHPEEE